MSIQKAYKDFVDGIVYRDIHDYIQEILELNRDILEGLKVAEGETNDQIRGSCRALRGLLFYINQMSKEGDSYVDSR